VKKQNSKLEQSRKRLPKRKEVNMMRRRAVGRSVARVAVGTAVVAGTAGAVHHHQDQKSAQQDAAAQQQQDQAYQQGAADAPPPPQYADPAPQLSAENELMVQLQQRAQLNATGVLTDAEFAKAAREKLLPG
jgi:hypothetical protein